MSSQPAARDARLGPYGAVAFTLALGLVFLAQALSRPLLFTLPGTVQGLKQMDGPEPGEVMAVVRTAMLGGLPYTVLRDAILAHPTMAEGLNALCAAIPAPTLAATRGGRE